MDSKAYLSRPLQASRGCRVCAGNGPPLISPAGQKRLAWIALPCRVAAAHMRVWPVHIMGF